MVTILMLNLSNKTISLWTTQKSRHTLIQSHQLSNGLAPDRPFHPSINALFQPMSMPTLLVLQTIMQALLSRIILEVQEAITGISTMTGPRQISTTTIFTILTPPKKDTSLILKNTTFLLL